MSSEQCTREHKEDKPVVAICYDFDKTLSPDDMQAQGYIQSVGYDVGEFWTESNGLASQNDMDQNLAYMHYVYNIYFDENGDIESMLVTDYADYVDGPHVTKSLFVIEPTPDADIQAWVEKVMEEKQ